MLILEYTVAYNAFEVVLWFLIGMECLRRGISGEARRTPAFVASIAFVLFALSDAVEIMTGAWWEPWWLFVWKAVCVVTLLALLLESRLTMKRRAASDAAAPEDD